MKREHGGMVICGSLPGARTSPASTALAEDMHTNGHAYVRVHATSRLLTKYSYCCRADAQTIASMHQDYKDATAENKQLALQVAAKVRRSDVVRSGMEGVFARSRSGPAVCTKQSHTQCLSHATSLGQDRR